MYIACGTVVGLVAAGVAFLFGKNLPMAVLAYALGGMIGMVAGLVWACMPTQAKLIEQPETERG